MANRISMKAMTRSGVGRTSVNKIRNAGNVPAVLYGGKQPMSLQINRLELKRVIHSSHSENMLVDLEVDNEEGKPAFKHLVLMKEIQHHPLKDKVLHVDLLEISENKKIHVEVTIETTGESIGAKNGGLLDQVMHSLKIACFPKDLPEAIVVNVEALNIGDSIHIKDLQLPAGVEAMADEDQMVFIVHEPTAADAEESKPAEAAEPEVIKEKKQEEAAS